MTTTKKKPIPRPKARNPNRESIIDAVLLSMREGNSLRKSCEPHGITGSTFLGWIDQDKGLTEQYAMAREAMIDKIADDTMRIADEPVGSLDSGATDSGAVAKQRLQIDTRKWLLSKLAPKKYGEKVAVTGGDENDAPVKVVNRIELAAVFPTR